MITFYCYSCGQKIQVDEQLGGRSGKCNSCGSIISIPIADAGTPRNEHSAISVLTEGAASTPPPISSNSATPAVLEYSPVQLRYAGFWIRVAASIIDMFVLLIPTLVADLLLPVIGGILLGVFYKAILLAQWNGQTVGKKLCNIKVISADGSPCTMAQAFGRSFAEILSALILGIGCLMVAFDEKKRGLHDHLAGTLHVYSG